MVKIKMIELNYKDIKRESSKEKCHSIWKDLSNLDMIFPSLSIQISFLYKNVATIIFEI